MTDPATERSSPPDIPPDAALLDAARRVRERAYAPYSGFKVGAALRTPDGTIHLGCNVENAAYPQGTCAEAGAIAAMIAAGDAAIAVVAIVGSGDVPCAPCGGCRQKLFEFAAAAVPVHMTAASTTRVLTATVGDLLPGGFGPATMAPGRSGEGGEETPSDAAEP